VEKPVPESLDLAIISAKHWRVIILKTGYCKISLDFFYYKSVTSLKLLKKTKIISNAYLHSESRYLL